MSMYFLFISFFMAILLFVGLQEQTCALIDKYLLPIFDIHTHWALDGVFLLLLPFIIYKWRNILNTCISLESGSVIVEFKNGKYDPLTTEIFLEEQ